MSILICGGAGYIGSHIVYKLIEKNYDVIILDNLLTGHKFLVNKKSKFYKCDIKNIDLVKKIFFENKIDVVINLAASSQVGESLLDPKKYYENNIISLIKLLEVMLTAGVKNIIFSSSAAVYGKKYTGIISEDFETKPDSVYGKTKLICENIISDYGKAYSFNYVILRYFNVAGADFENKIGEAHIPETHLIPNVLQSIIKKNKIKIFGNNFNTHDGTCVRDYIHVDDLSNIHVKIINNIMLNKNINQIFNLGNSKGFSVLEIIKICENITGEKINFEFTNKRDGDPDILISNCEKIKNNLNFKTKFSSLENIIKSSWKWHKYFELRLNKK